MATMLTILQNEITLLLSSFRAVDARKACLSTALAGCDDCYLNAIVATAPTFMTNQPLQCGNMSLSQSAVSVEGCGADAGCSETMMKDQQVVNCFTGYQSYVGTAMASAGDDPAKTMNVFCSYVEPIKPTSFRTLLSNLQFTFHLFKYKKQRPFCCIDGALYYTNVQTLILK